jgi:hypothetical protein
MSAILSMASEAGGVKRSQSASAGARVAASALNVIASTVRLLAGMETERP